MNEQEIEIQIGDNPFDTKKIKVQVPSGTKILCTEPYLLDSLSLYGMDYEADQNIKLCENKQTYITQGNVVMISKEGDKKISALIDIGTKFTAYCSLLKEYSEIVNQLEVGMIVDVKVKTLYDGTVTASISDAIEEVQFNEILKAIGNKSVGFNGKVTELINGGYWVEIGGINCFMPGSLAGLNKLWDFESIVGKQLLVMPISFSNEKNTIIVSHREYLETLIPNAIDELGESNKELINGIVTGTTKFGVFAEFNECLTGLIPDSELDESTLNMFSKKQISPGDSISFWLKDIISNKKIILTQKGPKESLWDTVDGEFKPMMTVPGKITKVTNYGAFIELKKGISGLIHKSRLKDISLNVGDTINVRIQGINISERKITLVLAD
jgi:small subunit ribosomal protein S1